MGSLSQNSGKSWFGSAIGDAWKLVKVSVRFEPENLKDDVYALAAPHFAVLMHKREKHFESLELSGERRWYAELGEFAARVVIPSLDGNAQHASGLAASVVEMLDAMVADEQIRVSREALTALPFTSRFETSWAT